MYYKYDILMPIICSRGPGFDLTLLLSPQLKASACSIADLPDPAVVPRLKASACSIADLPDPAVVSPAKGLRLLHLPDLPGQ